jgi:uncharacterized protein YcgI (DUF1989 family)
MADTSWSEVISPGLGKAFDVRKGESVRIQQTEGGQVADVVFFAKDAPDERVSCSNTIMYNMNLNVLPGSPIFSNRSQVMLRVADDTVKSNNLFLGCCSLESFKLRWDLDYHPSCHEILRDRLAEYGLPDVEIPPPVNFFMNWPIHADGSIEMGASPAKPGDYVELVAEMDIVLALSICPQELTPTNNFRPTPLQITWRAQAPPAA